MEENFDIAAVSDPVHSARYTAILDRAQRLAEHAQAHYGPGRGPIRCRFTKGRLFQASAGCEGNGYVITIGAAVPVLMMALFRKLLNDPFTFPAFLVNPAGATMAVACFLGPQGHVRPAP